MPYLLQQLWPPARSPTVPACSPAVLPVSTTERRTLSLVPETGLARVPCTYVPHDTTLRRVLGSCSLQAVETFES